MTDEQSRFSQAQQGYIVERTNSIMQAKYASLCAARLQASSKKQIQIAK